MKEISNEEWQIANDLKEKILKHRENRTVQSLESGEYLKEMRDKKLYKALSYDSFKAFIEDGEVGVGHSSAYDYIKLYTFYIVERGHTLDYLKEFDSTKLKDIIPVFDQDPEHWLSCAKILSKSDLINETREARGIPPMPSPSAKHVMHDSFFTSTPSPRNYLEWVKNQECVICRRKPVDLAHWPITKGAGGTFVIPLCRECHMEQEGSKDPGGLFKLWRKPLSYFFGKLMDWINKLAGCNGE